MAILQDLREKAGPLVAIVIGVSLLLFVVSDFFGNNTSQRRQADKYYQLALIDGEAVSYQDFKPVSRTLLISTRCQAPQR